MKIESSITSISWIPSEAIEGISTKLPFEMGIAHYDAPPPDVLDDLEQLRKEDRFRFANELRAWIEVEDGVIKNFGQSGGGHIGVTTLRLGPKGLSVQAVPFPDLRPDPEVRKDSVRFIQTAGGRTGVPAPRRVKRKPFIQVAAPLAWTTLELTMFADGRVEADAVGASPFPRHWIYDDTGKLFAKSGIIDFKEWYHESFGKKTPWGAEDSPALVTKVESALERQLSASIMTAGRKPEFRHINKGDTLVKQGEPGYELFLLLDGVLAVEDKDRVLTEMGPGTILGEKAVLEGGIRTMTLRALTKARVAVVPGDAIDPRALQELSKGRRHEER